MFTLVALALSAAFAIPAEAARDVEAKSVACIQSSDAPARVADELDWLAVKFELRVANRLAVPAYRRFAQTVARGRSTSPALRKLRSYVAAVARQDARLVRMRLDFCAFLEDWRGAGWPRGYFDTWEARKLKQAGIDAALVDRLGLELERLAPGLMRLGLTRDQADRLVTTAELIL